MSAVSVTPWWISDSPRRKPRATATTTVIVAAPPPTNPATVTSAKRDVTTNNDDVAGTLQSNSAAIGGEGGGGGVEATRMNACGGSRGISFAPGTTFHDRSRLKSRGSSKKVSPSFHFRPTTSGEKPQTPRLRFKLPKATLPSLHYLSVSQEDFLDPRYAQDIVKTYGIPRYFFRSKSNLLTSPSKRASAADGGGAVVLTGLSAAEDGEQKQATMAGKLPEAEDARSKTSGETFADRFLNRFPVASDPALVNSNSLVEKRAQSGHVNAREFGNETEGSEKAQLWTMLPVYKPLIGEKYTNARFFPSMNPYRSLQLESEVDKYVRHKKRVGLGRYVEFTDTDNNSAPSSAALVREASMYDLNHEVPAQRRLDLLPPPDRKPFLRHRPSDPKQVFVRSSAAAAADNNLVYDDDDDDVRKKLVIMRKERPAATSAETSSINLREQVRP